MTKFNPENKDVLTYGECLGPAMAIMDQEDANQYMADYVKYCARFPHEKYTHEQIAKINLGYFAGYYGVEVQRRVQELFLAPHHVFGSL